MGNRYPDPNIFLPRDHGFISWTYDPADIVGGNALTNGDVRIAKLVLRKRATVTSIKWGVITSDNDPVAGQCQLALYDPAGNRLHTPIDIAGDVTSTGYKSSSLPAPLVLTDPFVWLAIVVNFTTGGTFAVPRATSGVVDGALISAALGVDVARFAQAATAQTSLPATVTPAAFVFSGGSFPWGALA